ncbi:MAG TPA: ATP-binding protein [Dongiaceae bacterium]|nr:ATP-binding protein [Dongiaceae bacterium]
MAEHPELAEAIRAALNPADYRVVHRMNLEEAEPLLAHGLVQACVVDMDCTNVQGVWLIEKLQRRLTQVPLLVFTSEKSWEWEEEAYLKGVRHVLNKPVRARMLNAVLARLWTEPAILTAPTKSAGKTSGNMTSLESISNPDDTNFITRPSAYKTWEVLRDFSAILTHSLNSEAMLKQFLLMLREIMGINRAAIFLRQPASGFAGNPDDARRLRSVCAVGLPQGLLDHLELSLEVGIGGQLVRSGRILRRNSDESRTDIETQKEFELLGAQVAVPVLDRENLVGVAVFDGRITGEPLANNELELIFHLLEQLGLAIKNIWLHDQVAANNEMMADVLRELSSACVVVSRDLAILHANKAARRLFGRLGPRAGDLEFTDLPQMLGGKIYQVLKTGTAVEPFKFEPAESTRRQVFNINVVPFQRQNSALPSAALLVVEDLTQTEQLQKLELEASNLRLVKTMADRLAHEVGNALVPLSTHQQLLSDRYKDPEFRASLDVALADGVKRISRLINQMRFLARDGIVASEAFPLGPLIEEAYEEAQKYQPVKSARLKYEDSGKPIIVTGDRAALKHALAEIILNALQSNPGDPQIGVRLLEVALANGNGHVTESGLNIEIKDNGTGFTPELAQKVPAPFFTTRNVGLGLGLTVCRRIIETHHGKLEILPTKAGQNGVVRISLPQESNGTGTPLAEKVAH